MKNIKNTGTKDLLILKDFLLNKLICYMTDNQSRHTSHALHTMKLLSRLTKHKKSRQMGEWTDE